MDNWDRVKQHRQTCSTAVHTAHTECLQMRNRGIKASRYTRTAAVVGCMSSAHTGTGDSLSAPKVSRQHCQPAFGSLRWKCLGMGQNQRCASLGTQRRRHAVQALAAAQRKRIFKHIEPLWAQRSNCGCKDCSGVWLQGRQNGCHLWQRPRVRAAVWRAGLAQVHPARERAH